MATATQIEEWFTYHAPDEVQQQALRLLRDKAKEFGHCLNTVVPESADKTAALRKLRECVMTANAAIVLQAPVKTEC